MAEPITTKQPLDANGNVIARAMGVPKVAEPTLVSDTKFVDIFDLSSAAMVNRVFTSIAVRNPSGSSEIEVAFGPSFASTRHIVCGTSQFFVLDSMMFGPSVEDQETGLKTLKVRAKLKSGTAQGTAASATIIYTINPTDGHAFEINGTTYEFCEDGSVSDQSFVKIDIKASADLTWTEAVAIINATEQAVTASINTGTDTVTITSVAGGSAAAAITTADISTGATFSGATLSGQAGGVTPTFHIW